MGKGRFKKIIRSGRNSLHRSTRANRLASNSLLEALVFADRVTQFIRENGAEELPVEDVKSWQSHQTKSKMSSLF